MPRSIIFPVIVVRRRARLGDLFALPSFAALNTDVTTGPAEDDRKRHWGIGLLTARSAAKAAVVDTAKIAVTPRTLFSCANSADSTRDQTGGTLSLLGFSGCGAFATVERNVMIRVRCVSDFRPIPGPAGSIEAVELAWFVANLSPPRMARSKIRGSGVAAAYRRPVQRVARETA